MSTLILLKGFNDNIVFPDFLCNTGRIISEENLYKSKKQYRVTDDNGINELKKWFAENNEFVEYFEEDNQLKFKVATAAGLVEPAKIGVFRLKQENKSEQNQQVTTP